MKKKFEYLEEMILVLTLAIMVALIFAQVVGRYVFSSAPSWTEEMARYIHIFQVWIGASYAVKKRQHIRIEAFIDLFRGTSRKILETVALIIWFGLAVFLAFYGTQLVLASFQNGQITPAMQIPMWLPFLAIPIGGAGMVLRLVQQFIMIWRTNDDVPSEEVQV
ncbi:MAG: TRAP transporter small permease [Bacillota bacterium]